MLNSAKCRDCGDVLVSTHVHDWVQCSCGAIFIDGGGEYIRRGGDFLSFSEKHDAAVQEINETLKERGMKIAFLLITKPLPGSKDRRL